MDASLDPNDLDDLGRALMRSMSFDELMRIVSDTALDVTRAEGLLLEGDPYGVAILERLARRIPRLSAELRVRLDESLSNEDRR